MRIKTIKRKTAETDIALTLNLDGSGKTAVDTGIGFLDHMLTLFAVHGRFDLELTCKGDLRVDGHHTTEDVGIVLGKTLAELFSDKAGLARYGSATVPMDEALVTADLDLSGRPYFVFGAKVCGKVGDFDAELTEEFFRAMSTNALMTLHIRALYGKNTHHIIEAAFKAFGRALRVASRIEGKAVLSSKGMLE